MEKLDIDTYTNKTFLNGLMLVMGLCFLSCGNKTAPITNCQSNADCQVDQWCVDGQCTSAFSFDTETNNLCDDIICNTPPQATCIDGSNLREYSTPGSCEDGLCEYLQFVDTWCDNGCVVAPNGTATCATDTCNGITCNTPPQNDCTNQTTLRIYAEMGVCVDGKCEYDYNEIVCAEQCISLPEADVCNDESCENILCITPPDDECAENNSLKKFANQGTCILGGCEYDVQLIACDDSCISQPGDDTCDESCTGITCNTPPNDSCADSNLLTQFLPDGDCAQGACHYESQTTLCLDGCKSQIGDDVCDNDPCEGVECTTPPENYCLTSSILFEYQPIGGCDNGLCTYWGSQTTCQDNCLELNGPDYCEGDPCIGIDCNTAPNDQCVDINTLEVFAHTGTCEAGICDYPSEMINCALGCTFEIGSEDDICEEDLCEDVTCNTPPRDDCLNDTTLKKYEDTGFCEDGNCFYNYTEITCPGQCEEAVGDDHCSNDIDTDTETDTGIVECGSLDDDFDEDGFSENQGDCNDCDSKIGYWSIEIPSNNIDDNCNGQQDEPLMPCDCSAGVNWPAALDMCDTKFFFSPNATHSGPNTNLEEVPALKIMTRYGDNTNDLGVKAGCRYVGLSTGSFNAPPQEGTDYTESSMPVDDPAPLFNGNNPIEPDIYAAFDNASLNIAVYAPGNVKGFSFDFIYLTSEYPEWTNQDFNDAFYAIIESAITNDGNTTNIAFDQTPYHNEISVNAAFFEDPPETDISGTGFFEWDDEAENGGNYVGGSTGWYRTSWPVQPLSEFFLTFSIHDESDGLYDSVVILDNFRWLFEAPEGATIQL